MSDNCQTKLKTVKWFDYQQIKNMTMRTMFLKNAVRLITLFLAFLVLSCDKDNDNDSVQLLESISHDGILAYKFKYDNQKRISEIIDYCYDRCTSHLLSYNSAGDLVSKGYKSSLSYHNYDYDRIWTFTKNGDKIIIDRNTNEREYFELDNQDLPIRRRIESTIAKDTYSETTYAYHAGNLSKLTFERKETVGGGLMTYKTEHIMSAAFIYDDKKSPFYNCNTPKWFLTLFFRLIEGNYYGPLPPFFSDIVDLQRNNRLAEILTCEAGWRIVAQETVCEIKHTYIYTYDDAGYPLTCKRDDSDIITTYKYVKK